MSLRPGIMMRQTNPFLDRYRSPLLLLVAATFYIAVHWRALGVVWFELELRGPDDFLRLYEALSLLGGQNWFDMTAHRMTPPAGADIHWSRFVDLPIAALVWMLQLVFDSDTSARLAAIIWPFTLYLAGLFALVNLCRILVPAASPFLVLFFYVLGIATMAETSPGRLDHHNVTPARVPIVGAIAGCLFALAMLRLMLPSVLGSTSDYFAGFVDRHFEPETEQDVIALCHRDNGNIRIRGYDNARLYFQNPHSERHTTVCLRRFNRVLEIDRQRNLVSVQSGAHFGDLLPLLDSMDLWLDNYPNYHFISVGACIATAVHGSNLDKPFLADLVQSIRYYDRVADQVFEVQRQDAQFADLIFNQNCPQRRIILSAQLQICPRQYYELNSERQPVESLSFDDETAFTGQTQHYEVRVNTPRSRDAILQSYQQVGVDPAEAAPSRDKQLLPIKADPIGRKWNLLQRNAFFSSLTSVGSRFFINYEWFFTPEEFARFWEDISSDRSRYRLYKLLVRYNRRQPDLNTPYHGTVSIDITILNTQSMLTMAAELYQRYRPLEHLGKYSIERYINRSNEHQTVAERSGTTGIRSPQIVAD